MIWQHGLELAAFKWSTLFVPTGVVLAALVSFTALFLTNRASLKSQRDSLERTLAQQDHALELTLENQRAINRDNLDAQARLALEANTVQRNVARDDRLFEKRAEIYPAVVTLAEALIQPSGQPFILKTGDYSSEYETLIREHYDAYKEASGRLLERRGDVALFAGDEALQAYDRVRASATRVQADILYLRLAVTMKDDERSDPSNLQARLKTLADHIKDLRQAFRHEMQAYEEQGEAQLERLAQFLEATKKKTEAMDDV